MPHFNQAVLVSGILLVSPSAALAQTQPGGPAPTQIESQSSLTSLDVVPGIIFEYLIFFLPAIATLYFVFAGYRYIIAQGNPEMMEKAKKSLSYAVFGIIVAYSSTVFMALVSEQVELPFKIT